MDVQMCWRDSSREMQKVGQDVINRKGLVIPDNYDRIWLYAREHGLANMSCREIDLLKENQRCAPSYSTLRRYLGKKKFWAQQLDCKTPKEGQKVLRKLLAQNRLTPA